MAHEVSLATPVKVIVEVPFDRALAAAAMERETSRISGALYHRLGRLGVDEEDSSIFPTILRNPNLNSPYGGAVYLFPATPQIVEFDRLFGEQQQTMKRWYLSTRKFLNDRPQAKTFVMQGEWAKYARATRTDEFGRYSFDGVKPGRYYLYADGPQSIAYVVYREFVNVGASPIVVDSRLRVDYSEMGVHYRLP
jgi:hypothetical protein